MDDTTDTGGCGCRDDVNCAVDIDPAELAQRGPSPRAMKYEIAVVDRRPERGRVGHIARHAFAPLMGAAGAGLPDQRANLDAFPDQVLDHPRSNEPRRARYKRAPAIVRHTLRDRSNTTRQR